MLPLQVSLVDPVEGRDLPVQSTSKEFRAEPTHMVWFSWLIPFHTGTGTIAGPCEISSTGTLQLSSAEEGAGASPPHDKAPRLGRGSLRQRHQILPAVAFLPAAAHPEGPDTSPSLSRNYGTKAMCITSEGT